jgi:predicted extracellular nuclease
VRRAGDQVEGITGILTRAFGRWRIHPTQPPRFHASNPRPETPPDATGIRAAALNLHNYFTDRAGRGARTAAAFERQRMRLRRLVRRLDPDLLALHEIENQPETVNDLLALLNDGAPPSRRYRATLRPRSDAVIRSVLIYRPTRLTLTRAGRQVDAVHPRDPVAARFQMANGVAFEVATAHFKSRGGCPDQGDIDRGAGCWAARRNAQSRTMIDWLATRVAPPSSDQGTSAAVLVLADFNAYAEETAIRRWQAAGYTDLIAAHLPAAARYTYNYHGRAGYLDHALASDSLLEHIADVRVWSINADEPAHLSHSGTGVWRLSDHDPIIIDLAAQRPEAQ